MRIVEEGKEGLGEMEGIGSSDIVFHRNPEMLCRCQIVFETFSDESLAAAHPPSDMFIQHKMLVHLISELM